MFGVPYLYMGKIWNQTLESREKIRQAKLKQYEGHSRMVLCKKCGKEYRIFLARFLDGRGKYCSKNCRYQDKRGLRLSIKTEFKKNQKPWNFQGNKVICLECKREFEAPRCTKRKFCNKECRNKYLVGKRGFWRNKHRPELMGQKNNNWRGGITEENNRVRSSLEYKQWRDAVFKRDDYTCQCCKKRGIRLEVHHVEGFAKNKNLRLNIDNGITYCIMCHAKNDIFRKRSLGI